jgi:hypothetical protein
MTKLRKCAMCGSHPHPLGNPGSWAVGCLCGQCAPSRARRRDAIRIWNKQQSLLLMAKAELKEEDYTR